MTGNGFKFEYTRALVRASKAWGKQDRCGNYLLVALAVHNYTDGDGAKAYASAARISRDTGIPVRTVERALKFLRDEGLIHQDEKGRRSYDGKGLASVYSLRIPDRYTDAAEVSQPATSEGQPATSASQPATSEGQSAIYMADQQILSNTPFTSNPSSSNPPGEPYESSPGTPSSMPNNIPTTRMEHDTADEYLPDDCFDCRYWKRACGNVRQDAKPALVSVAAEPDWDSYRPDWADDEPPWN